MFIFCVINRKFVFLNIYYNMKRRITMRNYSIILIISWFATLLVAKSQDNESAYSAYQNGNYERAIELYSAQIKINQEYAPIFYNRGLAYMRMENFPAAIADLNKAVQLDKQNADAYYTLAIAHTKMGDYSKAIDNANQATEINPNNAQFAYAKANIYYMMEDDDNSIAAYNRVIELDNNNAMAYYGRAVAYKYKNQNKLATEDFNKFLQFSGQAQLYVDEANRMLQVIENQENE